MTRINCCQFIDMTVEGTVDVGTSVIKMKQGSNVIEIPMSIKDKFIESIKLECGEELFSKDGE